MEKIIGAQLYTIRDYTTNAQDVVESFKKLRKIGYTRAQVSAMNDTPVEAIKTAIEESGVKVTGDHYAFDRMIDDPKAVIERHKAFGCMNFGIGGLPGWAMESGENILKFMKQANEFADMMASEGMMFTYHNHAFEFVKVDGKNIMDYIIETAGDNFKLMADVHWLAVAGKNPSKFLKDNKDLIGGVHYKDLKVVNNAPAICEVGSGNLDWEDIIKTCDELGVEDIFVEQDSNWSPDPFTSLEMSYNFLTKYGYR